jgi:hypothetical protein
MVCDNTADSVVQKIFVLLRPFPREASAVGRAVRAFEAKARATHPTFSGQNLHNDYSWFLKMRTINQTTHVHPAQLQ